MILSCCMCIGIRRNKDQPKPKIKTEVLNFRSGEEANKNES